MRRTSPRASVRRVCCVRLFSAVAAAGTRAARDTSAGRGKPVDLTCPELLPEGTRETAVPQRNRPKTPPRRARYAARPSVGIERSPRNTSDCSIIAHFSIVRQAAAVYSGPSRVVHCALIKKWSMENYIHNRQWPPCRSTWGRGQNAG